MKIASLCIDQIYFQVPRRDLENEYRERVYCYELYHQLRTRLEKDRQLIEYTLNGELDKAGTKGLSGRKPDFAYHHPGNDSNNLLTMEVKSANNKYSEFKKDVDKLKFFQSNKSYYGGIMLIYGEISTQTRRTIKTELTNTIIGFVHLHPSEIPKRI